MSGRGKDSPKSVLDDWWAAMREEAEQGNEYPEEVMRRIEEVGDKLADYHLLDTECRQRLAATARAIRAFARRSGVALPRSQSIEARPGPGPYAIELSAFEAGPCVTCGAEAGAGPVGRAREPEPGPLCDTCFMKRCGPLGTVLWQITAMREVAELECGSTEEKLILIGMLATLGRLMQGSALEEWPVRPVDVAETLIPALERLEQRKEVD